MWYLGVCEGRQGRVSARATGGTHSLWRRQANGQRHHLSRWSGRKTLAGTDFVPRKLWNSNKTFQDIYAQHCEGKGALQMSQR